MITPTILRHAVMMLCVAVLLTMVALACRPSTGEQIASPKVIEVEVDDPVVVDTPPVVASPPVVNEPPSQVPPSQTVIGAPALPVAVANTHDLMELFSEPLFQVLATEMKNAATTSIKWESVASRGVQTSEIANLIALRQPENKAWHDRAQELHLAGQQLTKMAELKEAAATIEAYHNVVNQCNNCHREFAPKDAPQLVP